MVALVCLPGLPERSVPDLAVHDHGGTAGLGPSVGR